MSFGTFRMYSEIYIFGKTHLGVLSGSQEGGCSMIA